MSGVVYITCTDVGESIIKSHLKYHRNIPINAIFNLSPKKGKTKSMYNSLDFTQKLKLKKIFVNSINTTKNINLLKRLKPKIIIQAGWSEKFSNKILKVPLYGCIGHHPSPLPNFRGAAVLNWAIILGKKKWGNAFFIMNEKYDDGPIISRQDFMIKNFNINSLYEKINKINHYIIKDNLKNWFDGKFNLRRIKKNRNITYLKKRKPEDGVFDFSKKSMYIFRLVKALLRPFPNAFFLVKGLKIYVSDVKIIKKKTNKKAGTFIKVCKNYIDVVAGDLKIIRLIDLKLKNNKNAYYKLKKMKL